jgi:hypothetical protein
MSYITAICINPWTFLDQRLEAHRGKCYLSIKKQKDTPGRAFGIQSKQAGSPSVNKDWRIFPPGFLRQHLVRPLPGGIALRLSGREKGAWNLAPEASADPSDFRTSPRPSREGEGEKSLARPSRDRTSTSSPCPWRQTGFSRYFFLIFSF